MIQRIQSVFLLLSLACISVLLHYSYNLPDGRIKPLLISAGYLSVGLILFTIFRFKNRKQQILFCNLLSILHLLLLISLLIKNHFLASTLIDFQKTYFGMPIEIASGMAFIVTLLAKRGIKKDEDLVRSADRLR